MDQSAQSLLLLYFHYILMIILFYFSNAGLLLVTESLPALSKHHSVAVFLSYPSCRWSMFFLLMHVFIRAAWMKPVGAHCSVPLSIQYTVHSTQYTESMQPIHCQRVCLKQLGPFALFNNFEQPESEWHRPHREPEITGSTSSGWNHRKFCC